MGMNSVLIQSNKSHTILNAVTTTGAGSAFRKPNLHNTFQATLSNTTTPTASVNVEVSNDQLAWIVLGTIALSGALDSDGINTTAAWNYVRGNVTAISGTSATVTLTMGG